MKRVRDMTPDELIYAKFIEGLSIHQIAAEQQMDGRDVEMRLRSITIGIRIGVRMSASRDRYEDDK